MATELDAAFGRLAVERGLASADALRSLYVRLSPDRTLAMEAVAQGLIAPEVAQRLLAELSARSVTVSPPGIPAKQGLPVPGTVLGERYQVRSLLGKGGMGAVYAAWDTHREEEVAIKVLLETGSGTDLALARFEREARVMAKVDQHAGIVRIRDYGRVGATTYAVLDLVPGRDLGAIIRDESPLPIERILSLTEAVARAIQHCHEQGVLHRDLKPANVLVRDADGAPFVTDFGVALEQDAERLTKTGEVLGTPAYMSPEQADGDKDAIDARTDVYGLGAILYTLIAGQPPFAGSSIQILRQVFSARPAPLQSHRPDTPKDVDVVCQKALSKDPRSRYPTAAALADDLSRLRRGEPITARPPSSGELFRWRLSRREPRALLTLLAPALVLMLGVALFVGQRIFQNRVGSVSVSRLANHLDRLETIVANGDPLGLEQDSRVAMVELISSLDAALKSLAKETKTGDSPSPEAALADRVERLGQGEPRDPADTALADLTDDPERRTLLRTFVRRAALRRRLGYRGGLPTLDAPKDGVPGEDLLMNALRLLRWREKAKATDPAPVPDQARALLREARKRGPKNVASAADVALGELDATLKLVRRQEAVYKRRQKAVHGRRVRVENDTRPIRDLENLIRDSNLGAFLRASLVQAKRRLLVPLLEENIRFVENPDRDWTGAAGYRRLRLLLNVVGRIQRAEPDVELKAVDRLAVDAVVKISVHAQKHAREAGLDEWVRLFEAAPGHLWSEGEVPSEVYDTAIYSLERVLNRPGHPPLELFLILPRLRITPGSSFLKSQIKKLLEDGAVKTYLSEPVAPGVIRQKGDAYFAWAVALQSILGQTGPAKIENARRLVELFAISLGDDLSALDRARLGLDPKTTYVALERPLTPFWRGYVRWRLVHYLVTLLDARPLAEQTAAAWKVLLDEHRQLHRARDSFTADGGYMGVDRWIVATYGLDFVTRTYISARRRCGDLTETDSRLLTQESLAALQAVEPWAWKLVELSASGSDAAMKELGIKRGSLVGTMGLLDLKRNVDRLLARGIRQQSYILGNTQRYEEALTLFQSTEDRLWKSRQRPPIGFYLDWVQRLRDAGDPEEAEVKVREVIQKTKIGLGTPDRKDFLEEFDKSQRILASIRLEAGDLEGARASLRAARAEGLGVHPEWRAMTEALEGGQ